MKYADAVYSFTKMTIEMRVAIVFRNLKSTDLMKWLPLSSFQLNTYSIINKLGNIYEKRIQIDNL